jgi:8-oxo-dGTP pyrophosphatase MutT (NUDIX family)
VVFRSPSDSPPEILLILRAEREGDPWSGQIALPGGRQEAGDATLQDTAVRETLEETGIDLASSGIVLGTLDELRPRTPTLPPIIVTPFVAVVAHDAQVTHNEEVAESFWARWSLFGDALTRQESAVTIRGAEWRVPSYVVGRHVVWGMTERILRDLANKLRGD